MLPFPTAMLLKPPAAGGGAGPTPTVEVVGAASHQETNPHTSLSVSYPAGLANGDIGIVFIAAYAISTSAPTWTVNPPSGWLLMAGPVDAYASALSVSGRVFAFWRRLNGTESGSITFTSTGNVRFSFRRMIVLGGCKTSGDPWEGLATNNAGANASSADPRGSDIVTVGNNRLGMTFIAALDDTAGNATEAGWTEQWAEMNVTSDTNTNCATKSIATPTTQAQHNTSNLSFAEAWASISFALLPEPAS